MPPRPKPARPCTCDRYTPGEPFVSGRDCPRCWVWHNNAEYRAMRQATATGAAPTLFDIGCIHRGEPTGTVEGCGCGRAPGIYQCAINGQCVTGLGVNAKAKRVIAAQGLAVCLDCDSRTEGAIVS